MRGCDALGSRHCRRSAGHDRGIVEVILRPAALAALALLLTACAATPRTTSLRGAAPSSSGVAALPISPEVASQVRNAMIHNALAMLGQPYRWGGSAPGGFDCSGLVFFAAAGAGIHLPRTAAEQRQVGTSVALKHLQPGDLLFMHLSHKELHVGIVLDNSRFIHAPSSGGHVRIDSIDAAPYSEGFIGARRIIDPAVTVSAVSSPAPTRGYP